MKLISLVLLLSVAFCFLQGLDVVKVDYAVMSEGSAILSGSLFPDPDSLVTIESQIDMSSIPDGFYFLRLLAWDSSLKSSHYYYRPIYHQLGEPQALTHLRYCFDGDFENVSSLPMQTLDPGNTWIVQGDLDFPDGTTTGLHILHLWTINESGQISQLASRIVIYLPAASNLNVSKFEWFFTGPGANPDQIYNHIPTNPAQDITEDVLVQIPALQPETQYMMHLTAVNEDGTTGLRSFHTFSYTFTIENLTITVDGNNIIISWDEIPNAIRYWVERKTSPFEDGIWYETTQPFMTIQPILDKEFYRVKAEQ